MAVAEFHYFANGFLPEHKDVLVRDLIAEEDYCTAIMLACTCKQERSRYQRLGYKWPFVTATFDAARKGYVELFKWLCEQCKADRMFDEEYQLTVKMAVNTTPNPELYKWFGGPCCSVLQMDSFRIKHWNVFRDVYTPYLTRENVHQWPSLRVWKLEGFHYVREHFGMDFIRSHLYNMLVDAVGEFGTLDDLETFELAPRAVIGRSIEAGNVDLLHAIVRCIGREEAKITLHHQPLHPYRMVRHLSVPLLEALCSLGSILPVRIQDMVIAFLKGQFCWRGPNLDAKARALVAYAGWTVPATIKTIVECLSIIAPEQSMLMPFSGEKQKPKWPTFVFRE